MLRYFVQRLLLTIPTILGVVTIVFVVIRLAPGDPAQVLLGDFATPEAVQALRQDYGLDQPLWVQYVRYLERVLTGDFGRSYATDRLVMAEVIRLFPYTLTLAVGALLVDVLIGVPAGVIAALRPHTWVDRTAMLSALAFLSMPAFWTGILLLILFSVNLSWFPVSGAGTAGDWGSILWHLVLPAVTLGGSRAAFTARMTRSCMLDVVHMDYVRTARAKGMPEWVVTYRHALRNALIQVVTVIGLNLGVLLGGSVIIENVFARPGIGKMLVDAITGRDYMQVQAAILFFACMFILLNLITDLVYALIDPRLRFQ